MNKTEALEILKAAGRDVSRLQKKVITNKQGQKQTVYVSTNKDDKKQDKTTKKEEQPEQKEGSQKPHIGEGTLPRGVKAMSKDGKEFTIKRDVPMKFTSKTEDGKMVFEHNGQEYTVDSKGVKDMKESKSDSKEGDTSKEGTEAIQSSDPKVRATSIVEKIKSKLKGFSEEQQKFFENEDFMHGSDFRSKVGDFIKSKAKGIHKAIKHEIHEIKLVGSGIKKVMPPPPYEKLSHHEKDALKTFGTHLALTVGTMALSGGIGHLVHGGLSKILSGVGLHYLEHAGLMSVGKALAFAKADENEVGDDGKSKKKMTDDEAIMKVINDMADYVSNADLSDKDWVSLFENQDNTIKEMEKTAGKKYSFEQKKEAKSNEQKESNKTSGDDKKDVEKGEEGDSVSDSAKEDGDFTYKAYMSKSLGKKRTEMPQFTPENLSDMLVHFSNHSKINKIKKSIKALKPTQGEINEDKILERIKDKYEGWKTRKYIISLDGYLLDGHHDWAYGLEQDPEQEVDCYRISLPIKNLLTRANKLKVAKKEDIEGNDVEKGKHYEMVTVNKEGKTFQRRQLVGSDELPNEQTKKLGTKLKEQSKRLSLKPKVEHQKRERTPQWYDKYVEKYGKMRGLPIGIDEKNVTINKNSKDPHTQWLMKYTDKKGIKKTVYTEEFMKRNAEKKWARIKNISDKQIDLLKSQPIKMLDKKDISEKDKQALACIAIIANTGLRPGSRVGFAKTKNRGVSTLSPDNVTVKGDTISFDFIGKSYQQNLSTIKDKKLADYVSKLKKQRSKEQFLFDLDRKNLIDTFRDTLGFKGLKLKDMRTYVATDLARKVLVESQLPPPPLDENPKKNKRNLQKKLTTVFETVSQKLNNTPAMAKNSYVHPAIIDAYIISVGMKKEDLEKAEDETKKSFTMDDVKKLTNHQAKDHSLDVNEDEEEDLDLTYPLPSWWDENLD